MARLTLLVCAAVLAVGCPKGDPCGDLMRDPETESCICPDGYVPRPDLGICEGPDGSVIPYDAGPIDAGIDAPDSPDTGADAGDSGVDAGPDTCVERAFFRDADGDGFGDSEVTEDACVAPDGFVEDETDCDDACETCFPGGTEICDERDNDCDGVEDEGVLSTFYRDVDGDTFGDPTVAVQSCEAPDGYVANDDDCNDACAVCRPGGTEVCEGALDENCSMGVDEGCACTNGAMRTCPGGTDAGACVAGTQTCTAGMWGACMGAVGPIAETCDGVDNDCDTIPDNGTAAMSCGSVSRATSVGCSGGSCFVAACSTVYDDCDGNFANGCEADLSTSSGNCGSCGRSCAANTVCQSGDCVAAPAHSWSIGIGTATQHVLAVAPDGGVVLAAAFTGTRSFGGATFSADGTDLVVAKYSAVGAHLWSIQISGSGTATPNAVGMDSAGNVYVAGVFTSELVWGSTRLNSTGGDDGFVGSLSALGAARWANRFGSGAFDSARSMDVGSDGNLYVGGTIGTGPALQSYTTAGVLRWSRPFAGNGAVLSILAQGSIVGTGRMDGTLDLGGGPLSGSDDVLALGFSFAGVHEWSAVYPIGANGFGLGFLSVSSTEVRVVGTSSSVAAGTSRTFAVSFSPSTGAASGFSWLNSLMTGGSVFLRSNDTQFLGGGFVGTVSMGGAPVMSRGQEDAWIARIDSSGTRWSSTYGGTGNDAINAVAVSADGLTAYVAGQSGGVSFGGSTIPAGSFLAALRIQ